MKFVIAFIIILFTVLLLFSFEALYAYLTFREIYYTYKNNIYCESGKCNQKCIEKTCILEYDKNLDIPQTIDNNWNNEMYKYLVNLISFVYDYENKSLVISEKLKTQKVLYDKDSKPFGYIFTDDNQNVWIIFRGTMTSSKFEVGNDLYIKQDSISETDKNTRVQYGFISIYNLVKNEIYDTLSKLNGINKIIVSGHSLGAAIATITSYSLFKRGYKKIISYTIGSPRLGNQEFVDDFNKTDITYYRVINTSDIVPQGPLPVMIKDMNIIDYEHCGMLKYFTENRKSFSNNHSISNYFDNVENII